MNVIDVSYDMQDPARMFGRRFQLDPKMLGEQKRIFYEESSRRWTRVLFRKTWHTVTSRDS